MITELQKAEMVARWAHKGQTDLSNVDYIRHVERVVKRLDACGDHVMTVAWLHDVVEDTTITITDLEFMGFSRETIEAVNAITHRPGEPLESYWTRVRNNSTALIVKLHGDMPDNNDPHRHTSISHEQSKRIKDKYAKAILHLTAKDPAHPNGRRDAPKLTIPDVDYIEVNGGNKWPTINDLDNALVRYINAAHDDDAGG